METEVVEVISTISITTVTFSIIHLKSLYFNVYFVLPGKIFIGSYYHHIYEEKKTNGSLWFLLDDDLDS